MTDLNIGPVQLLVLFGAGIAAGFINTLAGGGSVLTVPALLFLGVPPQLANGTNRVAVAMQNMVSSWKFNRAGHIDRRDALETSLPGVVGAVAGAFVAVELPPEVFDLALGFVLIVVVVTLFLPKRTPDSARQEAPGLRPWIRVPVYFLIGLYAGFVQLGVGFLLIAAIAVSHSYDLVRTNALKVVIVLLQALVAILVFALHGSILWSAGILLGLGTMAGAWLGVRFATDKGSAAVRWVVAGAALVSAVRLFWQ